MTTVQTKYVCHLRVPEAETLEPFQIEGVQLLMSRRHNLLADDMGLGKTIQAIVLFNSLKLRKILVICKASIKYNWKKKIEQWSVDKRVVQIIEKKTDFMTELAEIVIVNYDLITHSFLFEQLATAKWDLVICDEAHALKSMNAKRTLAVLAKSGIVHQANRTLMMTGTPVLNRPIELYPILRTLAPKVIEPYSDYFRYAKRYCGGFQDGFGFNDKGASHTDELNKKLRQFYMIRRTSDEVQSQLPELRFETTFIDSTSEIQDKVRTVCDTERTDFKHQSLGISAGEMATLRRETAESKLERSIDLIKEWCDSSPKLVIFAYHHSVIDRLMLELKDYNPIKLDGGTHGAQREAVVERFKLDPTARVFIGQIQAAGEGIDGLQDVCAHAVFIEWSWVPGEIRQAVKRLHRMGQSKSVLIRFLVWANTVEEHMMRIALDKEKVIKEIVK